MTTKTVISDTPVIESRDQLIASFAKGEKLKERWRIGTEHEKFVYALGDHHAPSYEEEHGIRALLGELEQHGWRPVEENGHVIAMAGADGSISLEPAGQFELSGAPLEDLHQTRAECQPLHVGRDQRFERLVQPLARQ
jgi:glutamate--cysteine ligase